MVKDKIKKFSFLLSLMLITAISVGTIAFAAGFSRQFNPEIEDFSITIGTHDSIMVSPNGNEGSFKDILRASDVINNRNVSVDALRGKVTHTVDEEYSNIELFQKDSNSTAASWQYLKFELYFISTRDMNVYLNSDSGAIVELDSSTADGLFNDAAREDLLSSVKIGFAAYSTIYQDVETEYLPHYSSEPVSVNVYSPSGEDLPDYNTFKKLGYSNNSEEDTILFKAEKEKITKLEVYIWVEAEELDTNLSALCNLKISMTFDGVIIEN